jgi:hypothetical protein
MRVCRLISLTAARGHDTEPPTLFPLGLEEQI